MQLLKYITLLATTFSLASALSLPSTEHLSTPELLPRIPVPEPRGGGGGRGGGSSGGSSSGGSSSGGSRGSGSSGSSGSSGGSRSGGSGRTGVTPAYGGRFAGGATAPYRSGSRSPGGIAPFLLVGGGLGFFALYGAYSWGPYGAYRYTYPAQISYYNQTSMMNETVAGECLCKRYAGCSCEAPTGDNNTYVTSIIGDGSYQHQLDNAGTYQVVDVDG